MSRMAEQFQQEQENLSGMDDYLAYMAQKETEQPEVAKRIVPPSGTEGEKPF